MSDLELLTQIIDAPLAPDVTKTIRDFLSDDNLYTIEANIAFFKDVPNEVKRQVIKSFISLVYEYEKDKGHIKDDFEDYLKSLKPKPKPKPSDSDKRIYEHKIKPFIAKLEQSNQAIFNTFGTKTKTGDVAFCNTPDEITAIYFNTQKIIDDLKNKTFKVIPKSTFYKRPLKSKNEIKSFLNNLQKKFNLQNVSLLKKDLIDNLS